MEWRFGRVSQVIVIIISLLNMCIALLAEYSAMGSLFSDYVGSSQLPIIIYMGVLTMAYTAYGGLRVSILTDRVQVGGGKNG